MKDLLKMLVVSVLTMLTGMMLFGWTTQTSGGTKHSFAIASATGAILGAGQSLPRGRPFLAIASNATSTQIDSLLIWSRNLDNSSGAMTLANADTLYLLGGNAYDGHFPSGVDSLHVFGVNDDLVFETSN